MYVYITYNHMYISTYTYTHNTSIYPPNPFVLHYYTTKRKKNMLQWSLRSRLCVAKALKATSPT